MRNRKGKGLTLVEILVVVAILSILITSLYTVFKNAVDTWSKSKARLDIIQEARVILDQISRELPGAFVDDSVSADFIGTDGGGSNPDTLEFVTYFAGKIYKLRYTHSSILTPGTTILMRGYIENPPNYANVDYADVIPDTPAIEEGDVQFGVMVNDIQFYYLPVIATPASTDWTTSVVNSWNSSTGGAEENKLPEAVKIVLDLKDDDNNIYTFQTIVYLPNSI